MASKSGSDIQIIVDVLGGGSISGESGKRIQHQIEQIISSVNQSDAVKLKFKTDDAGLLSRITSVVNQINGSGRLVLKFASNNADLQKTLLGTPFKLQIDTIDIQKQISDAIANMAPSSLPLSFTGGSGFSDEEKAIAKIANLRSQIAKRKEDLLGLRSGTAEAKELNRQITELEGKIGVIRSAYSLTHNGAILSVTAPFNEPQYINADQSRHQREAASKDAFDGMKQEAQQAEVQVNNLFNALRKATNAEKALPEWKEAWSAAASYMQKSVKLTGKSHLFDASKAADQLAEFKELDSLLPKVTAKREKYNKAKTKNTPQPKPSRKSQQELDLENIIKLQKERYRLETQYQTKLYRRGNDKEKNAVLQQRNEAVGFDSGLAQAKRDYIKNYGADSLKDAIRDNEQLVTARKHLAVATQAAIDRSTKLEQTENTSFDKIAVRAQEYFDKYGNVFAKNADLYKEYVEFLGKINDKDVDKNFAEGPKQANAAYMDLVQRIEDAHAAQETLGQKITRVFKDKFGYGVMAGAAASARKAISQLYTNVVELEDAMAQMKIVTGASAKALKEYSEGAADAAKATGRTMTEIMASSTEYARLGYNLEESLKLSETTAKLSNVADIDTAEATSAMTAILKGFRLEASDAEMVGDMMTEVANKYAIDAGELGAALERGGASLAAANNTLAESMALMAAGNAAIQNAEIVGKQHCPAA